MTFICCSRLIACGLKDEHCVERASTQGIADYLHRERARLQATALRIVAENPMLRRMIPQSAYLRISETAVQMVVRQPVN